MTLKTPVDALGPVFTGGYAVAALVRLGWEDMLAFLAAAEAEGVPAILQAGPSCRAHTPLPVLGEMSCHLADHTSVPVVAHLGHGQTFDECPAAFDAAFNALMFDGSRLPLVDNFAETARGWANWRTGRDPLRRRDRLRPGRKLRQDQSVRGRTLRARDRG